MGQMGVSLWFNKFPTLPYPILPSPILSPPLLPCPAQDNAFNYVCDLLGVDPSALVRALTTRKIIAPDGVIVKRLKAEEALETRDALAKAAYAGGWCCGCMCSQEASWCICYMCSQEALG